MTITIPITINIYGKKYSMLKSITRMMIVLLIKACIEWVERCCCCRINDNTQNTNTIFVSSSYQLYLHIFVAWPFSRWFYLPRVHHHYCSTSTSTSTSTNTSSVVAVVVVVVVFSSVLVSGSGSGSGSGSKSVVFEW